MTKQDIEYKTIVDERAFALSAIHDLPCDKEELERYQSECDPSDSVQLRRSVTEYEAVAYGIEDVENALVILALKLDGSVLRMVLDNSSGCFRTEPLEKMGLEDDENQSDEMTFGENVANYIGACQGRRGCEFDDEFKGYLKRGKHILTPTELYLIHVCLLQPHIDLGKVAGEMEHLMSTGVVRDKALLEYQLLPETLSQLNSSLQQKGVSVSTGEARIWLEFCAIRTQHSNYHGSSDYFNHLYDPKFGDIDEALKDHQLFSALINGPKDWARSPAMDSNEQPSRGQMIANYIGACQGRSGYEFDDACHRTKRAMRTSFQMEPLERYAVHACLLQPEVDLEQVAALFDRAMDFEEYFGSTLWGHPVPNKVRRQLIQVLNRKGVSTDEGEVLQWVKFCEARTCGFDSPGSPKEFADLYEPKFSDIDQALADHRLFSALINGPKDWPATDN